MNRLFENAALAVQTTGERVVGETVKTAEDAAHVAYCMERHIGRTPEEARHAYHVVLSEHLARVPLSRRAGFRSNVS